MGKGMRIETQLRKRQRAIEQIKQVFSSARIWKHPSKWITSELIKTAYVTISDCPARIKEYCRGYAHALLDEIWKETEFCYIINGVQHSTWKQSTFPRVPAADMTGNPCAHFWKGTDKPYTELSPL